MQRGWEEGGGYPNGTLHPNGTRRALPSVGQNSTLNPPYLPSAVGLIWFSLR